MSRGPGDVYKRQTPLSHSSLTGYLVLTAAVDCQWHPLLAHNTAYTFRVTAAVGKLIIKDEVKDAKEIS